MPLTIATKTVPRVAAFAAAAVCVAVAGCSATSTDPHESASGPMEPVSIPREHGPGVSADTITISVGSALLWHIPGSGTPEAEVRQLDEANQAVVDYFNQQGGIKGRNVAILPPQDDPGLPLVQQRYEAYTQSNGLPVPDPSNGKEVCDAYANTAVFALLSPDLVSPPYGTPAAGECLNEAGHPVIGVGDWTLADYQAAWATAGLSLASDRRVDAMIAAGQHDGAIGPEGKYALLTDSTDPHSSSEAERAAEELADVGAESTEIIPVAPHLSQAEALSLTVKMKSSGIDHILLLVGSTVSGHFLEAMSPVLKQQEFFPTTVTLNGPPPSTLNYWAQGMPSEMSDKLYSYASAPDPVTGATDPRYDDTPGKKLCEAVTRANKSLSTYINDYLCTQLRLLKDALNESGSRYINAEAFSIGLGNLATYPTPTLIATSFEPDQHDGAAGVVRVTYSAECDCDVYSQEVIGF